MTSKNVCITVSNQSGRNAKTVSIIDGRSRTEMGAMANNSTSSILINSSGENSYVLLAVLENGDSIRSLESYIEGGYRMKELIKADSIVTRYEDSY